MAKRVRVRAWDVNERQCRWYDDDITTDFINTTATTSTVINPQYLVVISLPPLSFNSIKRIFFFFIFTSFFNILFAMKLIFKKRKKNGSLKNYQSLNYFKSSIILIFVKLELVKIKDEQNMQYVNRRLYLCTRHKSRTHYIIFIVTLNCK